MILRVKILKKMHKRAQRVVKKRPNSKFTKKKSKFREIDESFSCYQDYFS